MKKELIIPLSLTMTAAVATSAEAKNERPNVIVILADDLGYGDVSAYGATEIKTPNLDRLANGGVRFTDGRSTSATSTPSRYGLFTGEYPWRKGAGILAASAPLIIGVDQFTMPKMFKSKGYHTAAIGKWHLGMGSGKPDWNKTITPGANQIGFDYSCLIAATNDRVPTVYVENGKVVGLEADDPLYVNYKQNFEGEPCARTNPEMLKMKYSHGHNCAIINGIPRIGYMKGGKAAHWVDEDMADYFVGKLHEFIDDKGDEPFFLYYGLHQPHVPRAPHSRFVGATKLGPRGDAIVEADWCIGELIKMLEKRGLLENTLIFFSSDNGPVLDDGYQDQAKELLGDHTPSGPLRGGKYSLFESGTRVPFFTYWKGTIKPSVSDALISQIDLLASFAKLIDTEMPEGLDSEEYLETLLGKKGEARDTYLIEARGRVAYRAGRYILIPPYSGPTHVSSGNEVGAFKEYALYDLKADIGQQNDIAKEQPELVQKLTSEFEALTVEYRERMKKKAAAEAKKKEAAKRKK